MTMTTEADRKRRLHALKLSALVRDHLALDGTDGFALGPFGRGAALVHDGLAWVLVDDSPETGLGPALAWARQQGAERLAVLAEHGTGTISRRAGYFRGDIDVWHVDGRSLLPAIAEPFAEVSTVPEAHEAFRPTIVAAGADPFVEHGVLVGEVAGLEVCRVVHDPHLAVDRLEVGTGAHDREAFQIMHGDRPTAEALAGVVRAVAEHRRVGADPHPLNRLGSERFLRWQLLQDPALVGLATLVPAEPPVVRSNLKDATPCVATGIDVSGRHTVVVCSTGVDLDLVPYAADARAFHADGDGLPELMIVVPQRDRLAVLDAMADRLVVAATVIPAPLAVAHG